MRIENPTVYSTEYGRHCPVCSHPVAECTCKNLPSRLPTDGIVRISRDSKGRKGKTVTIVTGLTLADDELHKFVSDLKRQCGAGGVARDGVIEIQGDHRSAIFELLKKKGMKVKIAGG